MKSSFNTLATVFAAGLFLSAGALSAQTIKTEKGDFKSSDGNKGTFVRTISKNGDTTTDTTVYTRESDKATRTTTETRTGNEDGTHTVDYSRTDFGSTAAYTSTKTVTKEKHGLFTAVGTYKTEDGDTGTLTVVESKNGPIDVTSNLHNSSKTGITQILDLHDDEYNFSVNKHITRAPDGTVTTLVITRYFTGL